MSDYRIEFGKHESGKWIPLRTLPFDAYEAAMDELRKISEKLEQDREQLDIRNVNVKMFRADDSLVHYITSIHPAIALPSKESRGK